MVTRLRYPKGYQFFDSNGDPLALGKLYYFESGGTAELDTYSDSAGTVENTNPVALDASGRVAVDIYLGSSKDYKETLTTAGDVTVGPWPDDEIPKAETAGTGTVDASGTPAVHQVAVFTDANTIAGLAVPASGTIFQGVAASDPAWTATPTLGVQQTTRGTLTLANTAAGAYGTTLQSSNSATAASTLTLPPAPPAVDDYVLSGKTTGVLSWAAPGGGSSTITVNSTATSGASAGDILTSDGTKVQKLTPGTGVATALAIAVGTAGAPVVTNGALGTPSGGTLTNCTGLPVAGGGTGLTTLTAHAIQLGNGTSSPTQLAVPASGTLLQGVATSDPTFTATPTLGVQQTTRGTLTLANTAAGAYGTTLQSSDSATAAATLTLPVAPPVADDYALTAKTTGVMAWASIPAALASQNIDGISRLGIGTTDTGNVLSVSGASTLFANGAGSAQAVISKHASGDTASYVFQDNFSGRAEFGLCGDDNFTMKVSADGSSWHTGLVIDKTTAGVTLGVQQTTQGSLTLSNTAAGAYATKLQASNSATAAATLTLPPAPPAVDDYVLSAKTTGVMAWVAQSGGSSTLTVNSTATSGASSGDIFTSDGSKLQKLTPGTGVATALGNTAGAADGFATYNQLGALALLGSVNNGNWSGTQLSVGNGGTGLTTLTAHAIQLGNGTSSPTQLTVPASGTILQGVATADPTFTATPTLGVQQTTQGSLILANTAAGAYATTIKSSNSASAPWTLTLPVTAGTSTYILQTDGAGVTSWVAKPAGTVTSVAQSFTGGLISVGGSPVTSSGTLALTVAGTSGGVPYFSSSSAWASSAALAANALVVGGGAGVAPATVMTGANILTALGVAVGSAGAPVINGGVLGTPSSGTLTNCSGLPIAGIASLGTNVATLLATAAGDANGLATLGGSGKLTAGQVPSALTGAIVYQGAWNATTNSPTIVSSVGVLGYYHVVSTAGTTTIDGISSWAIGDTIIFNGSVWEKVPVDTAVVNSVAGLYGTVTGSALLGALSLGTGVQTALAANVTGSGNIVLATSPTITGEVLAAGTASVAPLNFTAGTNRTTPGAGALEYDGHAPYFSPVAGVRGVVPVLQYSKVTASGGMSLNDDANAQSFLPSGAQIFPVEANVYYRFRAKLLLNLGTTTARNKQFLFATASGAAFSWIDYTTHNQEADALLGGGTMNFGYHNSASAESYGSSVTKRYVYTVIEGEFLMSAGGTIQPQIQFTVAPGGTNTNMQGSYFELNAYGPNAASAGLS